MHRIDADGNVAGLFTDGDPMIPQVATEVDAAWLNDTQENVCRAIEAAGITLVKGTYTQLRDAIQALAAAQTATSTVDWTGSPTGTVATISRKGSGFVSFMVEATLTGGYGVSGLLGTIHIATCRPAIPWFCHGMRLNGSTWSVVPIVINPDGTFASNVALSSSDGIFISTVFPGA